MATEGGLQEELASQRQRGCSSCGRKHLVNGEVTRENKKERKRESGVDVARELSKF